MNTITYTAWFSMRTCAPRVRAPSSGYTNQLFRRYLELFASGSEGRGRYGPYARGRGAWAAACVAVAFRIAWPPLWVDTEPALPRPRSPALRTNTYVLESELAASSRR